MDLNRVADYSSYGTNDMPPYPAKLLSRHVAVKGIQVGSLTGVVIIPLVAVFKGYNLVRTFKTGLPFFAAAGASISLCLLFAKNYKGDLDSAGVDDRAYRIRNNAGQNKVDYYSGLGAVAGASIGAVVSGSIPGALATSVAGVALGVAGYAGEAYYDMKYDVKPSLDALKAWVNSIGKIE